MFAYILLIIWCVGAQSGNQGHQASHQASSKNISKLSLSSNAITNYFILHIFFLFYKKYYQATQKDVTNHFESTYSYP